MTRAGMAPGLRLRDATDADAEALHALYHAAYAPSEDPDRPAGAHLKDTVEDVRGFIRGSRVLIAEDEAGRIVGTIALRRVANLRRLAVAPDAKRQGIGGALLEAGVEAAREEGFEVAMLDTIEGHPWLVDLYRRHGFVDRCVEHFPDGNRWRQLRRTL